MRIHNPAEPTTSSDFTIPLKRMFFLCIVRPGRSASGSRIHQLSTARSSGPRSDGPDTTVPHRAEPHNSLPLFPQESVPAARSRVQPSRTPQELPSHPTLPIGKIVCWLALAPPLIGSEAKFQARVARRFQHPFCAESTPKPDTSGNASIPPSRRREDSTSWYNGIFRASSGPSRRDWRATVFREVESRSSKGYNVPCGPPCDLEADMRALGFFLCAALGLTLPSIPAYAQEQNPQEKNVFRVRVEAPGGWTLWDDSHSELINSAYQPRQGDRTTPLVNIYNVASGEKRSIDILKEFPNARYVYVTGLASGPDGSVLAVCEVGSDSRSYSGDRLLVYDSHSTLVMNLTSAEYDVGGVAMDKRGDVYFVGTRDGENSSDETYPLLVKYDSQGKIALETLPRSLFEDVDNPVGDGLGSRRDGVTRVAVSEKAISVYLAPAREMIVLNQAGEIQTRINVASTLSEFARTKGYKDFYVDGDEFSPSGDLWFVGHLEEPSDSSSDLLPARNFIVRLTPEGRLQVPYPHVGDEPPGHYLPQLIGFTRSNEPVASVTERDSILVQKSPY
jgi:hypothetical protein